MTIEDPPEWFKIEAYSGTASLDFEGWRTQLSNRICLQFLLDAGFLSEFDVRFESIQDAPFYDLGFEVSTSKKAVNSLTLGQAFALGRLADGSTNYFDSCDATIEKSGKFAYLSQGHFTVDLHASFAEISSDFEALIKPVLAQNRQSHPREREFGITQKVIDSWGDFQTLPYIDLALWARRNQIDMPSHTIMATWLFLETTGDKNKAAVTKQKAQEMLQLSTLRRLAFAR